MKTQLRYATLALAALLVLSLLVCGVMNLPARAATPLALTITGTQVGNCQRWVGAVEAASDFDPADVAEIGIDAYRIYGGMSRWEKVDDDGVYGSPTIAEIKANPNVIDWTVWDAAFTYPYDYEWTRDTMTPVTAQEIFAGLHALGVEPVVTVRNRDNYDNPTWSPNPPVSDADWNEWWQHVFATVYWLNVRNDYEVKFWEVHNEPDNGGQGWGGTMEQYYDFITYTNDAVKTACGIAGLECKTFAPVNQTGGDNWAEGSLQNRDSDFDVLDYHRYTKGQHDQSSTSRMYNQIVRDNNPDGIIEPIFNSEWGTYRSSYDSQSTAQTFMWNVWQFSQPGDDYVWGSTIFSLYSWPEFDGIIMNDGTKTETFYAMATLTRALSDGKASYEIVGGASSVYVLGLKDTDGFYISINNRSGTDYDVTAEVSAHVSSGTAQVFEYSATNKNVLVATPAVSNGQVTFTSPSDSIVSVVIGEGGGPPPTDTPVPPTDTPVPPTDTPEPGPTDTPVPPTDTPEPGPTDTPVPPTDTPIPPTDTPAPPTDTPAPPTDTPGGGGSIFYDDFEDGDMSDWSVSDPAFAQIRSDQPYEGSYCAGSKLSHWFAHTVSTAGYTNVRFKYAGMTRGLDAGEYLLVEWYDGSTWHEVEQLYSEQVYVLRDWDMPAGADDNASFAVRFTTVANKNVEWAYADIVEVTGQ
jgi:hypothetical protein